MDQQKSTSTSITKRAQISLLLLSCTLGSIAFLLLHLMIMATRDESLLSYFFKKQHESSTSIEIIDYFKWFTESACKKEVYFGGPLLFEQNRNLTLVDGQKAVCLDDKVAPQINNCLVYSFGIHDDWHFEKAMENLQGCHVS